MEIIMSSNFQKITKSVDTLSDFLIQYCEGRPWNDWFGEQYCNKCENVEGRNKDIFNKLIPESYCEHCDYTKCRYFDHYLSEKEICELWLKLNEV